MPETSATTWAASYVPRASCSWPSSGNRRALSRRRQNAIQRCTTCILLVALKRQRRALSRRRQNAIQRCTTCILLVALKRQPPRPKQSAPTAGAWYCVGYPPPWARAHGYPTSPRWGLMPFWATQEAATGSSGQEVTGSSPTGRRGALRFGAATAAYRPQARRLCHAGGSPSEH